MFGIFLQRIGLGLEGVERELGVRGARTGLRERRARQALDALDVRHLGHGLAERMHVAEGAWLITSLGDSIRIAEHVVRAAEARTEVVRDLLLIGVGRGEERARGEGSASSLRRATAETTVSSPTSPISSRRRSRTKRMTPARKRSSMNSPKNQASLAAHPYLERPLEWLPACLEATPGQARPVGKTPHGEAGAASFCSRAEPPASTHEQRKASETRADKVAAGNYCGAESPGGITPSRVSSNT